MCLLYGVVWSIVWWAAVLWSPSGHLQHCAQLCDLLSVCVHGQLFFQQAFGMHC